MNARNRLRLVLGCAVWLGWLTMLVVCGLWVRFSPRGDARPALLVGFLILVLVGFAWVRSGNGDFGEPDPVREALKPLLEFLDMLFLGTPGLLAVVASMLAGLLWPWLGPWALKTGGLLGLVGKAIGSGIGVFAGFFLGGCVMLLLVYGGSLVERAPLLALGLAKKFEMEEEKSSGPDIVDQGLKVALLPFAFLAILANPKGAGRFGVGGP